MYLLIEKKNKLAVHGIFHSKEAAEKFLQNTVPTYVSKGFYSDKSLTANSFKVVKQK
jgi:hypothetical protein